MRGIIEKLLPGVNVLTRPRMSVLAYSGSKKITRLPRRSAVVAFSADEVYAHCRVDPPPARARRRRPRFAQPAHAQCPGRDLPVGRTSISWWRPMPSAWASNLDLDHVAFAADRKFDGYQFAGSAPPSSDRSPDAPAATCATAPSA